MKRQLFSIVTATVFSIVTLSCVSCSSSDKSNAEEITTEPIVTEEPTVQTTLPETVNIDLFDINSLHAILIDADTGEVIAEKAGYDKIYPASMTKIMTAIVAIENFNDLNAYVTIPEEAVAAASALGGSTAGFWGGETITALDLLYGILLPSGCECCISAGIIISGSESAFVELMNQKAAELGMTGTHFENATGLHNDNHYSTPNDIAKLMRYAYSNEIFKQVDTTFYHRAINGKAFSSTMFTKIHDIYGNADVIGGRIIGGKTGTTDEAGSCLCSYAEIYGKRYILCTTNAQYSGLNVADAKTVYNRLGHALDPLS